MDVRRKWPETDWLRDKNNWYYMDQDGMMQTGWCQVGADNWYYLNAAADGVEGLMQTGWHKENCT